MKSAVMKKKDVAEELRRKFDTINGLCARIASTFEMEDIHAYRVEIKKLRAFIHLCAAGQPVHAKFPSSLKSFYQLVGDIRNLQLQLKRIHAYFPGEDLFPADYVARLEEELAGLKQQTAQLDPATYLFIENEKIIKHSASKALDKSIARKYTSSILYTIHSLRKKRADERLHTLRKTIKELNYNRNILASLIKKQLQALPARALMKSIMYYLGENQDLRMALYYLQDKYIQDLLLTTRDGLAAMSMSIILQKDKNRQELKAKLKEL